VIIKINKIFLIDQQNLMWMKNNFIHKYKKKLQTEDNSKLNHTSMQ